MDRNRNAPGGKAMTDDGSVKERLQRLARNEQQRIEAERQPHVSQPPSSPASELPDSRSEPSYRQLTESVSLLRDFCRQLEHQSAYLSVRLTHKKSSAEAEFVVGNVDEAKFRDSKTDWATISLLRTVRIGNVRENYEHTKGVAEIVETGEVLRRTADVRAYLNDKLLAEIALAVGRWRADHDRHIPDEPGAKEEIPLDLAVFQCELLLNDVSKHLATRQETRMVLADVIARLYKLRDYYGFEDDWPTVALDANFAWLTPVAQALRAHDLVRIAQEHVQRYAEEQGAEARDHESDVKQAEANADRLADEAFYDVGLEKRLEADLAEAEEEYDHYRSRASFAEEVAAALTECLKSVDSVLPDLVAALAARRGTVGLRTTTTSTEPTWKFKD